MQHTATGHILPKRPTSSCDPALLQLLLSWLLVTACSATSPAPRAPEKSSPAAAISAPRTVTITRDNWGIPHVHGQTDADAVFGLLYAQCEDDFNRVETNYIKALGRLAEVEGESALYQDLRMRLFIDAEVVKQEYAASPSWLKALLDAWAAGINRFLATHPQVKPKLLTHFEPWMPLAFSEGSIGGDIEGISEDDIKTFYAGAVALPRQALARAIQPPPNATETRGSNGIAIGAARSATGHPLLLINPHTSFYFRPEVHVKSDTGLNAYGAVTWGQFFVYQGFNAASGWMHTSSHADVVDYYAETVIHNDTGYWYHYGSELRPVVTRQVNLRVRQGDALTDKSFTVYATHHGPIVRIQDGKWISVKLMVEHEKALTQAFLRTKSRTYAEFRSALELRSNSSNNTVYADALGNIAYFHGNFMPRRNPAFDWSGAVDGANPATEWQGLHALGELITLHNPGSGWLQNCNSTPFTAAGAFSPKRDAYPTYMAPDEENARGIHAVRLLETPTLFTLESLLEAAYDPYLPGFEAQLPALFKAYDQLPARSRLRRDLKEPIDVLRTWDLRSSLGSIATTLAVYWGRNLTELPGPSGTLREPTSEQRLAALARAVQTLTDDFGTWRTAWGEVNRLQRVSSEIQQKFDDTEPSLPVPLAPGRWGALASFDARAYPGTKRMYGTNGNSFVAAVEFGEHLRAKSLLVGGQSGDPTSPHFFDQAALYAAGHFKDVLFYDAEIAQHAERTYELTPD